MAFTLRGVAKNIAHNMDMLMLRPDFVSKQNPAVTHPHLRTYHQQPIHKVNHTFLHNIPTEVALTWYTL